MSLKFRGDRNKLRQELFREVAIIENDLVEIMQYVGELFVNDARQNLKISGAFPKGDYQNRTANLRSSIGYFVLKHGNIVHRNLQGTEEGIQAAIEALKLAPKVDLQLIGVAGMNYASYVESKGYNVITSQGHLMTINLERHWKRYKASKNLNRKFKLI